MIRKIIVLMIVLAVAGTVNAATQQEIQQAIDDGLDWLASTQQGGGNWLDSNGQAGYVAATASAVLAFIEEGYLPGTDYIDKGDGVTNRGDVVGKAVNYIYSYATYDGGSGHPADNVYFRSTNNDYNRSVYTTGVVTPVIYALGKADPDAVIVSSDPEINGKSYKQVMQSLTNWFTWGQNPDGGWRYYPNQGASDNSTAQWGALPYLYAESWGIPTPAGVQVGDGSTTAGLDDWTAQVQNPMNAGVDWRDGGSGYNNNYTYVNMAKTAGMLLEFAVMDLPVSDTRVQNALYFMQSMEEFNHWMQGYGYSGDQWYGGNIDNPYAMWAVYKALEVYGFTSMHPGPDGILGTADDYLIGSGISTAPGGFTIGQDWDPTPDTSLAGDWYSHYCEFLVNDQNLNGSWTGNTPWTNALATGWYINILNATGAPEPIIPVPAAFLLGGIGLAVSSWRLRRRKEL